PRGLSGPNGRETLTGLERVDREWTRHAGVQLRFTITGFDAGDLARENVAVAVAREADGRISAFATFRPTGSDGGWVLDLIRRSNDGSPGALEACIVEAVRRLGAKGATTLSLGLAPLSGLRADSASREERLLRLTACLVGPNALSMATCPESQYGQRTFPASAGGAIPAAFSPSRPRGVSRSVVHGTANVNSTSIGRPRTASASATVDRMTSRAGQPTKVG